MKFRKMQMLVRALRSGRYRQAQAKLRETEIRRGKRSYAYCCLGVATRVAGGAFDKNDYVKGTTEDAYLTPEIMAFFGFFHKDGTPLDGSSIKVGDGCYSSLASANDDGGCTFDEIADAIKANWRNL